MKHLVAPTSGFTLTHRNSTNMAEITIQLSLKKPIVTVKNSAYIEGVFDLTTGKKNPGLNYCEIDEKNPTILNDWLFVSQDSSNELTLNLKTKLKKL